jgi:hypothetical protein
MAATDTTAEWTAIDALFRLIAAMTPPPLGLGPTAAERAHREAP